jgi:hypothetical protein
MDTPAFAEWTQAGKKYPTEDTPDYISEARATILTIPRTIEEAVLPPKNMSVCKFIHLDLPLRSSELIWTRPERWFSQDLPTTDITLALKRHIPPEKLRKKLGDLFGQQWFNGTNSIIDRRVNNGTDRLPLWILTYWEKMATTVHEQGVWKASNQWLKSELQKEMGKEDKKIFIDARNLLDQLPRKAKLTCLRGTVTTFDLSTFLGTDWLNDDHINMMTEELSVRVSKDKTLLSTVILAPTYFADTLTRASIMLRCAAMGHKRES